MTLTLGFSPCPNDCFMFDAIVHRRIDLEGLDFAIVMDDVEALNRRAFAGNIDVTKLSYHAFAHCATDYALLDAGSALGRGCGPLLISSRPVTIEEVAQGELTIAIPGQYTTAKMLLALAFPRARRTRAQGNIPAGETSIRNTQAGLRLVSLLFSEIESAVLDGRVDAGVIIHENRFTYEAKGLRKIVDLGELWEQNTRLPIPLGGIVVNRSLSSDVQQAMNRVMRRSVEYAFDHPDASREFVRAHAQEMSDEVMRQHIELYVNEFSVSLGSEGRKAIDMLFERAAAAGLVAPPTVPLVVSDSTPP